MPWCLLERSGRRKRNSSRRERWCIAPSSSEARIRKGRKSLSILQRHSSYRAHLKGAGLSMGRVGNKPNYRLSLERVVNDLKQPPEARYGGRQRASEQNGHI